MKTLVVNFFGGPGAGKSTIAAALFAELKSRGVLAELATEYAKDKVWEESFAVLDDQLYVLGKQAHKIRRLNGKVSVIVTDSPLLLSLYYGRSESEAFKTLVLEEHNRVPSLNVLVLRRKTYDARGRMQNEKEAMVIDTELRYLLDDNRIDYIFSDLFMEKLFESAQVLAVQVLKLLD